MIERRAGGESGVRSVTCLAGDAVWQAGREGVWSRALLDAAISTLDSKPTGTPEELCKEPEAFLIEHTDGFRSAVLMLNGFASSFLFAAQSRDRQEPVASHFWLQEPSFGHFSYLTHNIETMFLSGQATYPVERTLLTTGVLDAAMTSRYEDQRRIETPGLEKVTYLAAKDPGRRAVFTDGVPTG
jgi:hypothetical protein